MPNNNPGGDNGTRMFGGFGPELPHGAAQRLEQAAVGLPKEARRSRDRAVRRTQQQAEPVPTQTTPDEPIQQDPAAVVSEFWQDYARDPNASELVKTIARQFTGMP